MGRFSEAVIDWSPFSICPPGEKAPSLRSLGTKEGLADRLRIVAFAEKQATHAFSMAADIYEGEVSPAVQKIWRTIAGEEEKHLHWLLLRTEELGFDPKERPQSLALWNSFDHCITPQKFAEFMANAEERGRAAGEQFYETLLKVDLTTARLFKQIALEESEHIRLAGAILEYNFQIPDDFKFEVEGLPRETRF